MSEQNGLKGLQMVQFECPRHWNPSVSSILEVGRISLFPLLALWGNKNGLPSMKVKELENVLNKIGSTGCKWSSLNAPGTEHQVWNSRIRKISEKNWLNRLQMIQFECQKHWNPCFSLRLGEFHFPIFSHSLSGVIRIGSPVWKWKSWKFCGRKAA